MNKEVEKFIDIMNDISKSLGMNDSVWINPSGLREGNNYSRTSCYDLAILACNCYKKFDIIRSIWLNNLESYTMHFVDRFNKRKDVSIHSTIHYDVFEGKYNILGGKTGGGDGYHVFVAITNICDRTVCCVIYGSKTPDERFTSMLELFDVVSGKRSNITQSTNAVCIDVDTHEIIYDKSCHDYIKPMSTSKMMTLFIALKYNNIKDTVCVIEDDIIGTYGTSGCYFNVGDIVTIEDLIYAALLPSSNQTANILARITGSKILNNYRSNE